MARVRLISILLAILFVFNNVSAEIISFVGEGYNPEPNEEITVQIQTDVPLLCMGIGIYVVGDANITGAMCEADCNQYGWDNGWDSDPDIDPNGWVGISGVSWASDANGIIGYIKFRYHRGQVSVYIDQENSSAYPEVSFSTDILLFGEPDPNEPNDPNDPNDPNFLNPNIAEFMSAPVYFPNLAGDANVINFEDFAVFAENWQKTGSELAGDFDDSNMVDFNDLKNFCYHWLVEAKPPEEVFELFKIALTARDINEAVNYIAIISRDKYHEIFQAIEPNLPDFAAGMGQITLISEDAGHKKYEMQHQNGGQTYSFPVVFIRDDDAKWRIFNF